MGYASARFNEIYAELYARKPTDEMKYPFIGSAGQGWIDQARDFGLTVSKTPRPGAIVV